MRIVKLGTDPHIGFATLADVHRFFHIDIRCRNPPGRFGMTAGRIAKKGLELDEELIFTYQGRVVFTARAGSGVLPNEDEDRRDFPSYFVVHLDTLRIVDEDLCDVERHYNNATGVRHKLAESQGWNQLPNSCHTAALWVSLSGHDKMSPWLNSDVSDQIEPSSREGYNPEDIDRRPLVERQIRERRGQSQFRDALRERYQNRCLITGCEALAVLEAAHISPYRGHDDNHPENGLLLRSDVHTLFDLYLLGIEPDSLRVELHPEIEKEYGDFANVTLNCRNLHRPSSKALRLHYERFRHRLNLPA